MCIYVYLSLYIYLSLSIYIYIYICIYNMKYTTTTCVPSLFCPRSRTTSEVVVRRALGLYFQQKLLEI